MSKRTRKRLIWAGLIVLILMALSRGLPSGGRVVITGPDGEVRAEWCGPGPHHVRVEAPDGAVAESFAW